MNASAKTKIVTLAALSGLTLGSILLAQPSRAADSAGATYMSKCAACHGKDGSGNTTAGKSLGLRDLRSAEVQAQSDAQLTEIIGKGKGKMPDYEKTLGADGVKGLVAFVRSLKH